MSELANLIAGALDAKLQTVHVCVPARVVSYAVATQTCVVDPIGFVRHGDVEIALPRLSDVPLSPMRLGGFTVHAPAQAGDTVLLVFSDRSLEEWRTTGLSSAPSDHRAHSLADAVALPFGVWPEASPSAQVSPTGLTIAHALGAIVLNADGSVVLGDVVGGVAAQPVPLDPLLVAALQALKPILSAILAASGTIAAAGAAAAAPPTSLASAAAVTTATTAAQAAINTLLAAWPPPTAATKTRAL